MPASPHPAAAARRCVALLILLAAAPAPARQVVATWTGTTGNWTNPALWSPAVPNNGTPPGTTYDAVLNGGGTVTIDAPIVIDQLLYRAGAISGPNNLTLNAPLTWSGGAFTGGGATAANGGATITGTTAPLLLDGRGLTLGGAASTWSSGTVRLNNGGSLTNAVGSVLTATGNDAITRLSAGAATFVNNGTFRKQGGTGTTTVGPAVAFINGGTVDVRTGTLNFDFSGSTTGSSTGAFVVAAGATLQFSFPTANGTYTLGAGSSVSGAGLFRITGSSTGISGSVSVPGTLDSGAVDVSRANLFASTGGRVASLSLTSGNLIVGQTLTVAGPMTWADGSIVGVSTSAPDTNLVINGGVAITGLNPTVQNSVRLTLAGGSSTLSGGTLELTAGTNLLANAAGSTFTITGNGATPTVTVRNGSSFENAGVIRFQGSSTVQNYGRFVNTGTLDVLPGSTLTNVGVNGAPVPLTNSGTVTVGPGGTLSGPVTTIGGGVLRGTGTLATSSVFSGPVTFGAGSTLAPGIDGPGALSITGSIIMAAGAAFRAELNGTIPGTGYDRLDLGTTGTVDLGGATLSTTLGFRPTLGPTGDALTILFGADSATQVTGTFANAPPGSVVYVGTFGGTDYGARVTYTTNSVLLDSFVVVPVPEPSALALALVAAAAGTARHAGRRVKRGHGPRGLTTAHERDSFLAPG
ncbi:MAG: hypothetical protein U0746_03650 [Gemmataceae bacterium]